jgi:hypothetical protein
LAVRKRNPQINAAIASEIEEVIAARAEALDLTKSKFVALIVEQWHANGAKPVSEADAALLGRAAPKKRPSKAS